MLRALFALLCLGLLCSAQQRIWDATNYPNPTTNGFRECNMKTQSRICDPDEILSEADRNRLNYELQQMEVRTQQNHASTFCEKKGITPALAIARKVRGSSEQSTKDMANNMKRTWTLDPQCQKSVVLVLITDDKKFWVARDDLVPVSGDEFTAIFNEQKPLLQNRDYKTALGNIVQRTWETVLSKVSDRGGSGGRSSIGSGGTSGGARPVKPDSKPMSLPSIPTWVWIALVAIVIPAICCCCCIYCCCCRNKNSGGGGGGGSAIDGGGGGGGGRGGGMFSRLAGGGLGGLGGLAGGLMNRGGGGGGGGFPMSMFNRGGRQGGTSGYHQGGDHPPPPYAPGDPEEGKGLYPAIPMADEGGGGSWGDPEPHGAPQESNAPTYPSQEKRTNDGSGGGGGW